MDVNSAFLEITACPLCGEEKTLAKKYSLPPYAAVQCAGCALWYLSPRLKEDQMMKLYAEDSYFVGSSEGGYTSYEAQRNNLKATFARFLTQLSHHEYTGGRLLEIGCGYGYLLEEAAPYFSYRVGTDFSQEAVSIANTKADRVVLGGVSDIPNSEELFDTIITVGVIEHIYSPLEFNRLLKARLKKGGVIIHATPHMGSFWRLLMGSKWPSFKVPEHVTYFDQISLYNLFKKTGLESMQEIEFPHQFSLALVAEKLGIKLNGWLGDRAVWLPQTMIAVAGKNPS